MVQVTTIAQSKRLMPLIPRATADAHYYGSGDEVGKGRALSVSKPCRDEDIPAWSLSALLEYLAGSFYVNLCFDMYGWNLTAKFQESAFCHQIFRETPIECCVKMIEYLNTID